MVMEIGAKADVLLSSHQTPTFSAGDLWWLQHSFGIPGLRLLPKAVGASFPLQTLAGHSQKNSSGEGLGVTGSPRPPPSPIVLCCRHRIWAAAHPNTPSGAPVLSGVGLQGLKGCPRVPARFTVAAQCSASG